MAAADGAARQNSAPTPPVRTQVCPACGTINDVGEPVCIRCGQRLYLPSAGDPNAYNPQVNSPFGKKGFHYGYAQTNFEIDGIPAQEVAAYVQQNADIYLTKFLYMDNHNAKTGFNWAGAFFPFLWLMYRKMYKTGLIVLCLFVLLGAMTFNKAQIENSKASQEILHAVMSREITPDEGIEAINELPVIEVTAMGYALLIISFSLRLAICLFVALKGDGLYRKKVVKDILSIREQADTSESYFMLLAQKGGATLGGMFGSFALYILFTIGLEQLAILIVG
jgi:hypothetical protein